MRCLFSFGAFLRDKITVLILAIGTLCLSILFLIALKAQPLAIITLSVLFVTFVVLSLCIEYARKYQYYKQLIAYVMNLDQAYLVLETLDVPNFYDGRILYEILYKINKSMLENIQKYDQQSREFQEYIEMWIHEVKTPLTTLSLMCHDRKSREQLKRIDDYIEQVLYFARVENAEHDYMISSVNLQGVVGDVASRNREAILSQNILLNTENLDHLVNSDHKWLEFILNQILSNSIKYHSKTITIRAHDDSAQTVLEVIDDGIGILPQDLPRIFDKSFTGLNGHKNRNKNNSSTGMGLYIAKTLCDKLGHHISATSVPDQGTTISITFPKNEYYNVTKK